MTERKLLELAPGSRWEGYCIVDRHSGASDVFECMAGEYAIRCRDHSMECEPIYTKDAIALLHSAGLLDELLAEAWDEGLENGQIGFDDRDNPYRKAGK